MTKRRTRGDGGLYQRHDHATCPPLVQVGEDDQGKPIAERADHRCRGRWVGTVEVIVDGRKRRKYVYGATSREAREKLGAANREKEDGTLVVASMTTAGWMTYWLDNIASRTLRPQTLRGYRSKVDRYINPGIGRVRLTALQPEHIRRMYDTMRADGLAEASVRQTHAILRRALKVAVQEGKLGSSPAERMESPGTETAKREQLTVEQAARVLRAAGDDARWWLAIFYGMRQGEVLGLRWRDVDLERHFLRVEQSLQTDVDGSLIFGPPKSKASRRPIPLLPQVEARLRILAADVDERTLSSDALVFHNAGRPIQPKRDWQAWRDLLNLAAVPPFAPIPQIALHAARNSAASLLEAAGVPARLAAQILGHAQVSMTFSYQDAELERMRSALEAVGDLLALE